MKDLSSQSSCSACRKQLDAIAQKEAVALGGRCMLCAGLPIDKPAELTPSLTTEPAAVQEPKGVELEAVDAPTHWKAPATEVATSPAPTTRFDRKPQEKKPRQCKHCGYDLAGLKSARCPECGGIVKHFTLRARMAEEHLERSVKDEQRLWVIAGLLAVAGLGVIFYPRHSFWQTYEETFVQHCWNLGVGAATGLVTYIAAMLMSFGVVSNVPRALGRLLCGYVAMYGVLVWLWTYRPMNDCIAMLVFPVVAIGGYHLIMTRLLDHDHLETAIFIVPSAVFMLGITWAVWYM
jgi:ribosomal protein L34E